MTESIIKSIQSWIFDFLLGKMLQFCVPDVRLYLITSGSTSGISTERLNPFHAIFLILYPLKTENFWFSDILRGAERDNQWHEMC